MYVKFNCRTASVLTPNAIEKRAPWCAFIFFWLVFRTAGAAPPLELPWRDCDLIVIASAVGSPVETGKDALIQVPNVAGDMVAVRQEFEVRRILWGKDFKKSKLHLEYLKDRPGADVIFSKIPVVEFRSGRETFRTKSALAVVEIEYILYLKKLDGDAYCFAYGLLEAPKSVQMVLRAF